MAFLRRFCAGLSEGKLFGMDCDALFALSAPKTVKIRDKKLGILKHLFILLIAMYIFIYEIGFNNKYLMYHTILPSLRLTFQQPTLDGCSPTSNSCLDKFKDVLTLPYCNISNGGCAVLDGTSASLITGSQILIPTVVQSLTQDWNSSSVVGQLTKVWTNREKSPIVKYVAGIVDYTIGFDHSISVPPMDLTLLTTQMNGKLFIQGTGLLQNSLCRERSGAATKPVDGILTNKAPCYINPDLAIQGIDIFRVSTILAALNIDIDVDTYGVSTDTLRAKGMTITMEVHYYNVWPSKPGAIGGSDYTKVDYVYTLSALKAPFKTTQQVWLNYSTQRTLVTYRGILITVASSSKIGSPEFQALLFTLTSSLALLAVSGVLVNLVAVYFLRFKNYYAAMLVEVSPDFSDVHDLESQSTDQLRQVHMELTESALLSRKGLIWRILSMRQEADDAAKEIKKGEDNSDSSKVAPFVVGQVRNSGKSARNAKESE